MRGKPERRRQRHAGRRIIPAHAGQTLPYSARWMVYADHPRACGANHSGTIRPTSCIGSSPRMRGKPLLGKRRVGLRRIIPAHAGQTGNANMPHGKPTDHPRACGANYGRTGISGYDYGSSPRMRGKPRRRGRHALRGRIIPAHAGQTSSTYTESSWITDHPRACGANPQIFTDKEYMIGSSPRMRGKLRPVTARPSRIRIIPAHAGQTVSAVAQHNTLPDHPRACGANDHKRATHVCSSGSSPRMRGKRAGGKHDGRRVRIIPAHAGQTKSKRVRAFSMPDHPRACGANRPLDFNLKSERGSSPRMRGKLFCVFVLCFSLRIIPAHAGQTPPFDALS